MNIPELRKTEEDLSLLFRLSRNPEFKLFRDYLTRQLDFFNEESIVEESMDALRIGQGARQVISDILHATEEKHASEVYGKVVEKKNNN